VTAALDETTTVAVARDGDVINARQAGREMAAAMGFRGTDLTLIATAISEVARNIVAYARHGEIRLSAENSADRRGICIVAHDVGPGIADIELAMRDGYSTGNSLGLGLPGARRLMDQFAIESEVGVGTTITMIKWMR
jgi:serine/threonine-protein kinase RsbT